MPLPAPNTLAIIGAGPIGLEAAAAAVEAGFDVHVFERGEVAAHVIAWGHVRMFTPWRMNVGKASVARLAAAGWKAPDAEAFPTGLEFAERYLEPIAALPELASRVHVGSRVAHVGRRGLLKGDDVGAERRAAHPFRIMVRDSGGRESFVHAFAVIDASGVYGQPCWAGDGGIPARGELYLAPQMSYHIDDVRGLRRERYAGKRALVIGAGASAATVVVDLAKLADEAPGTAVTWVTRAPAEALYPERPGDPLPERRALHAKARALVRGEHPAVRHVGGAVVDGLQYNSATYKYTAELVIGAGAAKEESDQVLVSTGFSPDDSLYRELQIHESWTNRAPMQLATAMRESRAASSLTAPVYDVAALANPEARFYILGHKSYGRSPNFLLETGYAQARTVVAKLAADLPTSAASPAVRA